MFLFLFFFFILFLTAPQSYCTLYSVQSGCSSDFFPSSFPIACILASKINKENNRLDSGSFPSLNQRSQHAPVYAYFWPQAIGSAFGGFWFHGQFNTPSQYLWLWRRSKLDPNESTVPVHYIMYSVVLQCLLRDYLVNAQDLTRNAPSHNRTEHRCIFGELGRHGTRINNFQQHDRRSSLGHVQRSEVDQALGIALCIFLTQHSVHKHSTQYKAHQTTIQ